MPKIPLFFSVILYFSTSFNTSIYNNLFFTIRRLQRTNLQRPHSLKKKTSFGIPLKEFPLL